MPRSFSSAIQSEVALRLVLRDLTEPAIWIAPPNSSSFSVSVVLPASGCEMIAKVRRRAASAATSGMAKAPAGATGMRGGCGLYGLRRPRRAPDCRLAERILLSGGEATAFCLFTFRLSPGRRESRNGGGGGPWVRNKGGGVGRRPAPGDIRTQGSPPPQPASSRMTALPSSKADGKSGRAPRIVLDRRFAEPQDPARPEHPERQRLQVHAAVGLHREVQVGAGAGAAVAGHGDRL